MSDTNTNANRFNVNINLSDVFSMLKEEGFPFDKTFFELSKEEMMMLCAIIDVAIKPPETIPASNDTDTDVPF